MPWRLTKPRTRGLRAAARIIRRRAAFVPRARGFDRDAASVGARPAGGSRLAAPGTLSDCGSVIELFFETKEIPVRDARVYRRNSSAHTFRAPVFPRFSSARDERGRADRDPGLLSPGRAGRRREERQPELLVAAAQEQDHLRRPGLAPVPPREVEAHRAAARDHDRGAALPPDELSGEAAVHGGADGLKAAPVADVADVDRDGEGLADVLQADGRPELAGQARERRRTRSRRARSTER